MGPGARRLSLAGPDRRPGSRPSALLHLQADEEVAAAERLHRIDAERRSDRTGVDARVVRIARAQVALHGDAVLRMLHRGLGGPDVLVPADTEHPEQVEPSVVGFALLVAAVHLDVAVRTT